MQSYNMMYPLVAFCLLALGHCQLTAQAAASITAPGCSQPIQTSSTSTIPATATVNMAIGQFPLFTPAVAPYLSAGVNSWTRSTTLINGTQTASGTAQLSLLNAYTNYLYTASYTVEAMTAVINSGFTSTSWGFPATSLSMFPTAAPTPTPLIGTLGVCDWTIVTTGPNISISTRFPVTRLFVPATFGTDGYFTPVPASTGA
ncbi:hypothetical protein NQ176_g3511 [Zarea fungicola]|uniref:Uncharacterized protein n=1 Tax=Zarea fungicola TaxID=93591 RepID=A0ACC1NK60_9HYPO|nr:hypothetical protein NQ176_g3511 [Lecanicillium fungicola]